MQEARLKHEPALTQEELAVNLQKLGFQISRVGVSKIETGLRQVRDFEVALLAQALEVSVGWLFAEDRA